VEKQLRCEGLAQRGYLVRALREARGHDHCGRQGYRLSEVAAQEPGEDVLEPDPLSDRQAVGGQRRQGVGELQLLSDEPAIGCGEGRLDRRDLRERDNVPNAYPLCDPRAFLHEPAKDGNRYVALGELHRLEEADVLGTDQLETEKERFRSGLT
jgi:hypothetical protein